MFGKLKLRLIQKNFLKNGNDGSEYNITLKNGKKIKSVEELDIAGNELKQEVSRLLKQIGDEKRLTNLKDN